MSLVSAYESDEEMNETRGEEEVEDDEYEGELEFQEDSTQGSVKTAENVDETSQAKSPLDGTNPASTSSNLNDNMTPVSAQATEASENQVTEASSIYTLENGFPAGCANIRIPPAPQAQCSPELQEKIIKVLDRMNRFGYSMNEDIHRKKNFKNPSIYEKLIESYGIDEFGSNLPSHMEDLKQHGYKFYDELNTEQRAEWDRKAKESKDRTKIEMVSAVKKK